MPQEEQPDPKFTDRAHVYGAIRGPGSDWPVDGRWRSCQIGPTICSVPRRNPDDQTAMTQLRQAAQSQASVCTFGQARSMGLSPGAIRRLVDSGRWLRMHRGVFLTASGPPTLAARMWAAHVALGTASVVAGSAAGHHWGLLDGELSLDEPIRMLLPDRIRRSAPGIIVRRVPNPSSMAHPSRLPPVLSVEHAVVDLVALASTDAVAIEMVLRACRLHVTTPQRILEVVAGTARVRRRGLIRSICTEVRAGVTSPLEIRYARDVVRQHGLPRGTCQAPARSANSRSAYRDVLYEEFGVIGELDGRLGHEAESEVFRDQWRDNAATLTGAATLRYGWLGVTGHSCQVAVQVSALLRVRG